MCAVTNWKCSTFVELFFVRALYCSTCVHIVAAVLRTAMLEVCVCGWSITGSVPRLLAASVFDMSTMLSLFSTQPSRKSVCVGGQLLEVFYSL